MSDIVYPTYMDCFISSISHGSLVVPCIKSNHLKLRTILKNSKLKRSKRSQATLRPDRVDVWFQDEARFGQQNTTTRLWEITGTCPRAVKQQQFEYAYLFGAVCPSTGATEAIIAHYIDMEMMREHLSLISKCTEGGRHAVIIVDGAACIKSISLTTLRV